MLDAIQKGAKAFFSVQNFVALALLFGVMVLLAYWRVTPERVAASIPRPGEMFGMDQAA